MSVDSSHPDENFKMFVLGVAVDHRLRGYIRELRELNAEPSAASLPSTHCDTLREFGQSMRQENLEMSDEEVEFACYLAEPAVQGGIVVALTQPPKTQTYDAPFDKVVEDCETLRAVREVAKFFGINFDSLSIFDAFPYIKDQKLNDEHSGHYASHKTFHEMILEKQPKVILTGWTVPGFAFQSVKTYILRKRPTGTTFVPHKVQYCGSTFSMVNMPHPSYFMNWHPTESCFRQLQILEFAQACGHLYGTWEEKDWMQDLRERCKERASVLSATASSDASRTERLKRTLVQLIPLLSGARYNLLSKTAIEQHMSKNGTIEMCSEASLLLDYAQKIKGKECARASIDFTFRWFRDHYEAFNKLSVSSAAGVPGLFSHECFKAPPKFTSARLGRQIEWCLWKFAKSMNLTWTPRGDGTFYWNFKAQSQAFLNLAEGTEDAMEVIPDNHTVIYALRKDVAPESLMERFAELNI